MFFTNYQSQASFLDMQTKETQLMSLGKPRQEFLYSNLTSFMQSEKRNLMLMAQRYYSNKPDILDRKRYYIDRNGVKVENTLLANAKLTHPFFRKLVKQKVNYILSKPYSFKSENEDFAAKLNDALGKKLYRKIKVVADEAIINGITWLQVYYDEMGELQFKRIPTEEVIPFWNDADHTDLDSLMRAYKVLRYQPDGSQETIMKVEYYSKQGVWYFIEDGKGLKPDPDRPAGPQGNYTLAVPVNDINGQPAVDANGQPMFQERGMRWEKIPFVAFKYNAEEMSLLQLIKALIDDYDVNASDTSNNLQDIPNSIKVVKGYDGTNKEEFTHNLAVFRTAFVSQDGDMDTLETNIDIAAVDSHLNRLRRDIYEFANGVNTQETDLGNASGVALKFRYADLDLDADDLANEFTQAFEQLAWFVKTDLINRGEGDFMEEEFEVIFNTEGIINESEVITDAKNSVGIISDETILANHPWVTDVKEESEKVKKQKADAVKEMQAMQGGEDYSAIGGQPNPNPGAAQE